MLKNGTVQWHSALLSRLLGIEKTRTGKCLTWNETAVQIGFEQSSL